MQAHPPPGRLPDQLNPNKDNPTLKPGGLSNGDSPEGDAVRRRAAIEEFYTDDCVLHVPDGVLVGHAALDKFAGELRATHPHFAYTPHGQAQALHNGGILAWGSGPKGEPPEYTGLDVVIVRESKIAELYVFLNPKLSAA
ncbi:MAG: nuclear transport factor 2 family protein [Mycobacterium sp.]